MDFGSVIFTASGLSAATAGIAVLVPILVRMFSSRSADHQARVNAVMEEAMKETSAKGADEIPPELAERILSQGTEDLSPGERAAKVILNAYSKDLASEAERIAKRVNAERPSENHVRLAAERIGVLRDRSGAISDCFLSIGSILAGAGVSFYVNILTGGAAGAGASVWAVGCLVAGVGCAVGGAVVKIRRS